jgi:hypothetical protein
VLSCQSVKWGLSGWEQQTLQTTNNRLAAAAHATNWKVQGSHCCDVGCCYVRLRQGEEQAGDSRGNCRCHRAALHAEQQAPRLGAGHLSRLGAGPKLLQAQQQARCLITRAVANGATGGACQQPVYTCRVAAAGGFAGCRHKQQRLLLAWQALAAKDQQQGLQADRAPGGCQVRRKRLPAAEALLMVVLASRNCSQKRLGRQSDRALLVG